MIRRTQVGADGTIDVEEIGARRVDGGLADLVFRVSTAKVVIHHTSGGSTEYERGE